MRVVGDEIKKIIAKPVLTAADLARLHAEFPELRAGGHRCMRPSCDCNGLGAVLLKDRQELEASGFALFGFDPPPPIPYVREVEIRPTQDERQCKPGDKLTRDGCEFTVLSCSFYFSSSDSFMRLKLGSDDPALFDLEF